MWDICLRKSGGDFYVFIYKIYKILSCPDHSSAWLKNYFEFQLFNLHECNKLKNLLWSLKKQVI